ncbi:MAG: hypothetical protein DWQ07_16055 [Chloroflexi bacterium]|nr:MAG: hypothetical protein DWQ07_16055 [Chloroflexota bacterium]
MPQNLEGQLWVLFSRNNADYLNIIDLSTGDVDRLFVPPECHHLFTTSFLICSDEAGQIFLYKPIEESIVDIPGNGITWVRASTNGDYLLYPVVDSAGKEGLNVLEISDDGNLGLSDFYEIPEVHRIFAKNLSVNGNHISYFRFLDEGYVIEILNTESGEFRQINITGPEPVDANIDFSPTDPIMLYGASDVESHIFVPAKYMYLVDLASGQTTWVANAPNETYDFFPLNSVWSPDGYKFFLFSGNEFCIFTIIDLGRDCFQVPGEDTGVDEAIWAPSGQHILIQLHDSVRNHKDLMVFDLHKKDFEMLLTNVLVYALDWRP